jgi:hypothetical protein
MLIGTKTSVRVTLGGWGVPGAPSATAQQEKNQYNKTDDVLNIGFHFLPPRINGLYPSLRGF